MYITGGEAQRNLWLCTSHPWRGLIYKNSLRPCKIFSQTGAIARRAIAYLMNC
ncbi:MAG: hypothetical protein LBU34_18215 [Planctomycetaceae bacterium]|nr:hypothetical protein [Planctomycetaceae bacterium]